MGYYVPLLKPKHKPLYWKLQFVSHKKKHATNSKASKPKKEWDIPKSRWHSLGFQPQMTIEQARARAKQLNAKLHIKRHEERRLALEEQITNLENRFIVAIPELYKQEFEQKYVFGRFNGPEWRKRFLRSWRAVQKMLIEIQLDPADWYDEMYKFYEYFHSRKYSLSYTRKILQLANLCGYFFSRKLGQTFVKVPVPRGKGKRERTNPRRLFSETKPICLRIRFWKTHDSLWRPQGLHRSYARSATTIRKYQPVDGPFHY